MPLGVRLATSQTVGLKKRRNENFTPVPTRPGYNKIGDKDDT